MKCMRIFLPALLLGATFLSTACKHTFQPQAPVSLRWEAGNDTSVAGHYESRFLLKNISAEPLESGWEIYFSQLPHTFQQAENSPFHVEDINGNFFRITPTEHFPTLMPGDSLYLSYYCGGRIHRNCLAPEAPYWVGRDGKPLPVHYQTRRLDERSLRSYPDAVRLYETNALLPDVPALRQTDIIPTLKQVQSAEEEITIDGTYSLIYEESFAGEAKLLKEKLARDYQLTESRKSPVRISLVTSAPGANDEAYTLHINKEGIQIASATAHGIFNGTQTLLAMLKGTEHPYKLSCVHISDYPDMPYRCLMLDVARSFTRPENVKHLIDQLAAYKMNVLHLHCCEDEAWRLEITGLEELTEVGSRRGHTTDESRCLYPGYSGEYDAEGVNPSNGYFSREEFIDLLRYAAARHIQVIPEVETPGHARAAIVSMKARYRKYASTNMEKATEYLLSEPEDTSRYLSVQSYDDNVMNVALPSTYRFIRKVVREIKAMYADAGVALPAIHLGGDEVANGAWSGSPACQALMKEKGFTKKHDLAEYFITQAARIMKEEGVKLSGWQEVALNHTEAGHEEVRSQTFSVDCWSAVPDWGGDALLYEIANSGYPVLMSNVCNFYMDMAYSNHPDERGLDWGGCVDEARAFSALPVRNYRSCRTNMQGRPFDMAAMEKEKPRLTEKGKKHLVGVSAQFFAETLRSYEALQYHLFPKFMGLVERGWNAHPAWEALEGEAEQQAYYRSLALFEQKIAGKEMPHWSKQGLNYRIAHPGLKIADGLLYANTIFLGAEIRYTTDGSEPTTASTLWTRPVPCPRGPIKAKAFYLGKESFTMTLWKD